MSEEETSHLKAEIARLNKIISVLLEQNEAIKATHSHVMLRFEANKSIDRKTCTNLGLNQANQSQAPTNLGLNLSIQSQSSTHIGLNQATQSQASTHYRTKPVNSIPSTDPLRTKQVASSRVANRFSSETGNYNPTLTDCFFQHPVGIRGTEAGGSEIRQTPYIAD